MPSGHSFKKLKIKKSGEISSQTRKILQNFLEKLTEKNDNIFTLKNFINRNFLLNL